MNPAVLIQEISREYEHYSILPGDLNVQQKYQWLEDRDSPLGNVRITLNRARVNARSVVYELDFKVTGKFIINHVLPRVSFPCQPFPDGGPLQPDNRTVTTNVQLQSNKQLTVAAQWVCMTHRLLPRHCLNLPV